MLKHTIVYIAVFLFLVHPLSFGQGTSPERVILNMTETPYKSIAVTWRTVADVDSPFAQVAPATDWTEFEDSVTTFRAETEEFITDLGQKVYHHSVIFDTLSPASEYYYRVGSDGDLTEWSYFTTADAEDSPFSFVYFGDPQNHNKKHVTRVLRKAYQKAPDASFWLFAGDIIGDPEDYQIGEFFYAGNPYFKLLPVVMIPGNHDRKYQKENGEYVRNEDGGKIRLRDIDPYWQASFTLPENGLKGLEETSYYFDYQGARFIMLNSNSQKEEQAVWLEDILKNNPNNWTIVTFHHPVYSAGRDRDRRETRDAFSAIMEKYGVDLVLTGHDHAYARSHKLSGGEIVDDAENGTVYVVSVSGPKMYSVNSNYDHLMAKTGGNKQFYQVISVTESRLEYVCYTLSGEIFDSFAIVK